VISVAGSRFIHSYTSNSIGAGGITTNLFLGLNAGNFTMSDVVIGRNTGIGNGTLDALTTGNSNTALGYDAGGANTTGSNNTFIGYNSGSAITTLSNVTTIGANAVSPLQDNTMIFGGTAVMRWGFGTIPVVGVDAIRVGSNATNGNSATLSIAGAWLAGSDRNKKHDITDINYGLKEVLALRPVDFKWNGTNQKDIGFIAQEVKQVLPELVAGKEGDMRLSYSQINVVLTKAIQEQQTQIEALKKEIEILKNK
jgi:hypothetical protein